jgi:hypothetical protein
MLTANSAVANQDSSSYFLDSADFRSGLLQHRVEVFSAAGPVLIDVTPRFEAQAQSSPPLWPRRVDVASPLTADYLHGGWFEPEGNHRWMGKQARVFIAGPTSPSQRLYLVGYCPRAQLVAGPLTGRILVEGEEAGQLRITHGDTGFEAAFPLPSQVLGKLSMEVTIQLDRTFRAPGDSRDLGLTFGSFEVR